MIRFFFIISDFSGFIRCLMTNNENLIRKLERNVNQFSDSSCDPLLNDLRPRRVG